MLLVTLLICAMSTICFAAERFIPGVIGKWYDYNDKLIYTINDYTINGYSLQSISGLVGSNAIGSGKFVVLVNGKPLTISMSWDNSNRNARTLKIGNGQYHSERVAQYAESVGGVHLGMTIPEVERLYGTAPIIKNISHSNIWFYPQDKWAICFEGGIVKRIAIPKGSTRKFDKTGFNADTPVFDYKAAYSDSTSMFERIIIGKNEYIWINMNDDAYGSVWGHVFYGDFVELNPYSF